MPARVRRVLARGLELDPGRRYPSMRALLDDLTRDPATRRRWLALGAGALACAAALGLMGGLRAAAGPCAGADRLQGERGAARRRLGRSALQGGDRARVPWRPASRSRPRLGSGASATLDAYARGWTTTRTEACEATRVRGEQSERAMELRMECLDDRLLELSALVGRVRACRRAGGHAGRSRRPRGLPPRERLLRTRGALTARVKPPADPAAAARVAVIRDRLATVSALSAAGKYGEALPVAVHGPLPRTPKRPRSRR